MGVCLHQQLKGASGLNVYSWLSAAASALAANVRCLVDRREDSEIAERQ